MFGNNVSHSKRHTRRTWMPNTQHKTLTVDGHAVQVNICTRCIRTVQKAQTKA